MDKNNTENVFLYTHKCIIANVNALLWQEAAPKTSTQQGSYKRSQPLNEKYWRLFWGKGQENGPLAEN